MKTMIKNLLAAAVLTMGLTACGDNNGYADTEAEDTTFVGYQTSVPVTPDSTATMTDDSIPNDGQEFEDTHPNDMKPSDYTRDTLD